MVALNRVIDETVFRYTTEGAEQAKAAAEGVAAANKKIAGSADGAAKAESGLARAEENSSAAGKEVVKTTEVVTGRRISARAATERLQRSLDMEYRLSQQLAQAQSTLGRAYEQGLVSHERQTQLLGLANTQFEIGVARAKKLAEANDNFGKSTGIASHHVNNLVAQLSDVGVSLQGGQSPFLVMTQQGSQILPILGETGVMGAVRGVGQFIGRFITPATTIIGGLTAAVVYGYGAWSRYDEETRKSRITLEGLGRGLGLTTDQFEALATSAARAGNMTARQSTALAQSLAATGKIGPENIGRLIAISKDFAATFSLDLDTVREKLTSAFGSLDGIKQLNQQLGFLDAKTQQYITDLYQQGRAQEALRLAIEKLPQALARQEDAQGLVERAWKAIKNAISDADHAAGRFLDRLTKGPAPEDKIEALKQQVKQARDELRNAEADAAAADAARRGREALQTMKRPGLENLPGNTMVENFRFPDDAGLKTKSAALTELEAKLDAALKKQADFTREQEKAAQSSALEKSLNDKSIALQTLLNTLQPGSDEFRTYSNYLKDINEAMKGGDTDLKRRLVDIRDYTELQSRLTHAVESGTNAEGRRMTEAEKAAEQRGLDITGIRARTTEERASLASAQAVARQRGQLVTQEQALADAQHAATLVREQDARQLQDMLRERQAEGAEIREQIRLVGADAEVRAVAIARRRAEQEIVRDGKDLHSEAAQAVIREAEANARLGVTLDRTTEAQRRMQDAQRQLGDEFSRFFDNILIAGQKVGDTFKGLAQSIASSGLRALLTGQGPLAGILGTAGEGGGLGGLLGGKGGFLGLDLSDLRKTFASGFGEGFDRTFGPLLEPGKNAAGESMGFMSTGLGKGLASAGIGASVGYSSASPLAGALSGGLAGLMTGNPLLAAAGPALGHGGVIGRRRSANDNPKPEPETPADDRDQRPLAA
ncbi:hypothetical protein ASG52_25235 [Methylobacterium sp. Leaf456]|uniref:phage tail length tape measure family protein n=1 Tax=Methylobacterium sp. Leaf456 TaxID=1736382 RepID=UPI0006F62C08|nr:phage tail length tape measure family protein [Methylobacterium sp. Leaf456]KQT55031.1 hypothetical protein ASG52_25235 [Methylobacterium sp. Leaf456]